MDIATAIATGKSALRLGQEIAKVVKKAQKSPDVVKRVLLYLESAEAAVSALGHERQGILTDVRSCDVRNLDQVSTLWTRLDQYLHEDNIRPQLESAIRGLGACRQAIEREAQGAWWRRRDKAAAVSAFSKTLRELEGVLRGLTSNFYPGGSGMGVQTLVPIFESLGRARAGRKSLRSNRSAIEALQEELGERACRALRDRSHEEWFRTTGKVEALVAELELAFAITVTGPGPAALADARSGHRKARGRRRTRRAP